MDPIPSKRYPDREFVLLVPRGTVRALAVNVMLCYRSYPQKVANLISGDGAPVLPVGDMTAATAELPVDGFLTPSLDVGFRSS